MSSTKANENFPNVHSTSASWREEPWKFLLGTLCMLACVAVVALLPLAFYRIHQLEISAVTKTELTEAFKEYESSIESDLREQSIVPLVWFYKKSLFVY